MSAISQIRRASPILLVCGLAVLPTALGGQTSQEFLRQQELKRREMERELEQAMKDRS